MLVLPKGVGQEGAVLEENVKGVSVRTGPVRKKIVQEGIRGSMVQGEVVQEIVSASTV